MNANAKPQARTDADARSILKAAGMTMTKHEGEYRVTAGTYTFPTYSAAQREAMAYYSDDRQDAVNTGLDMAARLKNLPGAEAYRVGAAEIAEYVNAKPAENIAQRIVRECVGRTWVTPFFLIDAEKGEVSRAQRNVYRFHDSSMIYVPDDGGPTEYIGAF